MKDRIKSIRNKFKMSQEVFGKRLAISGASVSKIESGENNPSDQTIMLICKEFGISEMWLRAGTGEMFTHGSKDSIDDLAQEFGLDRTSAAIMRVYVELPQPYRTMLHDVIRRMGEAFPEETMQEEAERLISEHLLQQKETQEKHA